MHALLGLPANRRVRKCGYRTVGMSWRRWFKQAQKLHVLCLAHQPIEEGTKNEWSAAAMFVSRRSPRLIMLFGLAFAGNPESRPTANCKTKVRCLMTICTARVSYETKLAALASNRGVWVVQVVLAEVRRLMQFVCPLLVWKHVLCAACSGRKLTQKSIRCALLFISPNP